MEILMGLLICVWVLAFLITVGYAILFVYLKAFKKEKLSKKNKQIWLACAITFFAVSVVTNAGNKPKNSTTSETESSSSEHKNIDSHYKLHKVNNLKTSYDKDMEGYQIITGDTDAPDDSVVLISTERSKETNEAQTDDFELVKVKDGHFKAYVGVSYVLWGDKVEKGHKLKIDPIVAENYDRTYDEAQDFMLGENQLPDITPISVTLSDEAVTYYNSLGEDSESRSEDTIDANKSKENLKAYISMYDQKERYEYNESETLKAAEYDDINDGYSAPKSKQFSVMLDNTNKFREEDADAPIKDVDKKDFTKEDLDKFKDYRKKLSDYFSNLHDYAQQYQISTPVINKSGTHSDIVASEQKELKEAKDKFDEAKQTWLDAYDDIMNR